MKVYITHSMRDRELAGAVAAAFRDQGQDVFAWLDSFNADNSIVSQMSSAIRSAHVVVAIISASNANIFYELGIAAGAGVPILVAAQNSEFLPSVLVAVPYVRLSGDISRDAQEIVRRAIEIKGLGTAIGGAKFESAGNALRAAAADPAVLESMSPLEFEELVAKFLSETGYSVHVQDGPVDRGVDLVIEADSRKIFVQVKKLNRQSRVSAEAVRTLANSVYAVSGAVGVMIATSSFTGAAQALAASTPVVLRTLDQVLAAKSVQDLLRTE